MELNQKVSLERVKLNEPTVEYDELAVRVTTVSFDIRDLDLATEKELVHQSMSGEGLVDLTIEIL